MFNLKKLFSKLTGRGDDAVRALNNGIDLNMPPASVKLDDFISKADDDWLTSQMYPIQYSNDSADGVRSLIDNSWNSNPTPEDYQHMFGNSVNPFTNPPTDDMFTDPYAYLNNLSPDDIDATTLNDLYKYLDVSTPADASTTGYLNSVLYRRMADENLRKAFTPNSYDPYMSDQLSKLSRKLNEIPIQYRSDSALARLSRYSKH